jgi:two-component system CheB/CheR fusion protein
MVTTSAPQRADPNTQTTVADLVVVGVCASAMGLNGLERLFTHLQKLSQAAYVVVLRQSDGMDPVRVGEALARQSGLPVEVVSGAVEPKAEHIYIGPADALMTFEDGLLQLAPARGAANERGSIDSFLISLAQAKREAAIGVLLAPLSAEGTAGVTALKECGGLALCEFDEARGEGDLHPLIDPAGLVDFVLPVEKLAERIANYAQHLAEVRVDTDPEEVKAETAAYLARIATVLRNRTGHDFHGYKHNTFLRRVQRRLQVLQIDELERYIEFLRTDADEVGHLFQDLLIGVTQFFRDQPEFQRLANEVLPKLFEGKDIAGQFRVWVLGCATGEEAYSIAILLREHMARLDTVPHVQIFATDIDGRALTMARAGRFPETIAKSVTPERLARWFTKEGSTYCVVKELREMCIFSQHNVIRDAPFSRIDLISCRNLLIYLNSDLQDRVMPLFHFALRPGGFLFLGPSENVTRHAKLFAPIDRKHRIFRRLESATRILPEFPLSVGTKSKTEGVAALPRPRTNPSLGRRAERIAERYAPAYVLIDHQFDVLNFSGRTGRFLEPAAGAASLNLLNLVHRDLRLDLRAALHTASSDKVVAKVQRLHMEIDGERRRVDLAVEPIDDGIEPGGFIVLFTDGGPLETDPAQEAASATLARDEHVQRLEGELRLIKERLQATIEELESTNEELKSSNEEYQSINEELQSANEELETSKEELQSVNEELQTVNGELAHRVNELARANSDMKNLLESTQIATVFLDNDLRVKSFTPSVAEIFHLIDTDLGRPIGHIGSRVAYPELQDDVRRVLRTLATVEREVELTGSGARYLARVLPYRSVDNFIAGAVLTFSDITAVTKAEQALRDSELRFRTVADLIPDLLWSNDADRRNDWVNQRWIDYTGQSVERASALGWLDVIHPEDRADTRLSFEVAAETGQSIRHEQRVRSKDGSYRWFLIQSQPLVEVAKATRWFGAATDIDDFKRAEERQKLLLAELQHRVKNILAVVRSIASRTVESSQDLTEFSSHFVGRLSALARTQSALARRGVEGVELEDLVREELVSHTAREGEQVEISGPRVRLKEKAAEVFTLALHELATNAVKYGALASNKGMITVGWRLMNTSEGRRLSLEWRESGVPLLDSTPRHRGFGRDLLERGLPYDLGAQTGLEFAPGGVRCTVEVPLSARVIEVEDAEIELLELEGGS